MKRSPELAAMFSAILVATVPQAASAQQSVVNTSKSNIKEHRGTLVDAARAPVAVQIFDANGRPTDKSTLTPAQKASIDRLQSALQDFHGSQPLGWWIKLDCSGPRCKLDMGGGEPPKH